MKSEQIKYILKNFDHLSTFELAKKFNIKERKIKKILEKKNKISAKNPKQVHLIHLFNLKRFTIAILSIIMLAFVSYSNTFTSPFLWDDINLVQNNPNVKSWKTAPKALRENLGFGVVQKKSSSYRPFQSLTYIIDHTFWGENVFGFHLTNIICHILSTLCAFWLIHALFRDQLLAYITCLLYIVHPIHTEAVTYISGRADPLSTIFLLTSLIMYIKFNEKSRIHKLLLMTLSFASALLSKENTIIFPILILLYHFSFKKKVTWIPLFTALGIGVLYVILRMTETIGAIGVSQTLNTTIWQRLPGTFVAMTNYFRLILFPYDLHMEYGRPLFKFTDPKAITGFILTVSFLTAAIRMRKSNALICFSIFWFIINILPVSNIYPVNAYMAEHWLYVPSISAFLLIAYFITKLLRTNRWCHFSITILSITTILSSYLTFQQNKTWSNPISFYEGLLKFAPNSPRLYSDLSTVYYSEKRFDAAIAALQKAIRLSPNYAFAHNNLGAIYNTKNQYEKAIPHLKKAVELNKEYDVANYNLGNAYKETDQNELALSAYQKAVTINPNYAEAYDALGFIYNRMGQSENSIINYKKALSLSPQNISSYNNLGSVYLKTGHTDDALQLYFKALALDPTHPGVIHNIGNVYNIKGDKQKAKEYYEEAIRLNSQYPDTYTKLAIIYQSLGNNDQAEQLLKKAAQLKQLNKKE